MPYAVLDSAGRFESVYSPPTSPYVRVSRYRLSSAAGVHAQRRATANLPPRVGAARTYAAYRPIRRSGTEDRAWARLRFRAPRPPLCGRAPPTHLAPAVDLHWPWWLAHIADRISGEPGD